MSWIDGARARLALLLRGRSEARMHAEIRFHIDMEADRLVRTEGIDATEARRRALATFGGVENHKEALRSGRPLSALSGVALDLKLGVRMLRKTPGLTLVGVLSLAVAIAVGAAYVEGLGRVFHPALPNAETARILRPHYWDVERSEVHSRSMHDFVRWRQELRSVDGVGAFRMAERNLTSAGERTEPQQGVETSALAFRILGATPLVGRTLLDSDEAPEAPAVAAIGEKLWRTRFGADSSVVGRTIHWGRVSYRVVGVMADGFAFPVNQQLWVPLVPPAAPRPGSGPAIGVFAYLAEGKTIPDLRAELEVIGAQRLHEDSATYRNLRPQVKLLYELADDPLAMGMLYSLHIILLGLLAICAANVAALVFARTMSRETELAVRTALGASRARIVWQLAAESVALCGVALVVGLAAAQAGLEWAARTIMQGQQVDLPFWWSGSLAPSTIVYAAALACAAAAFIGAVPALRATMRATMRAPGDQLKRSGVAGSTAQFGRLWTGVIVGQVAIAVMFLLLCGSLAWNVRTGRYVGGEVALPAERFVTARLRMDGDLDNGVGSQTDAFRREFAAASRELVRHVQNDPSFAGAAVASQVPGRQGPFFTVEVDGSARTHHTSRSTLVSGEFFGVTGARIVAGRALQPADVELSRPVAVVDESFVREILGGGNAIGRQVREVRRSRGVDEFGPWLEIVGVVSDLVLDAWKPAQQAVVYRPMPREGTFPVELVVATRGPATVAIPRLKAVAARYAPDVQLHEVMPMSELGTASEIAFRVVVQLMVAVGTVILMLAGSGVHALTAFTVARRRREIGIRTALGANQGRVLVSTFGRVARQIGTGAAVGAVPGVLFLVVGPPEIASGAGWKVGGAIAISVIAFVIVAGTVAAAGPLLRALRAQPTEILRAE